MTTNPSSTKLNAAYAHGRLCGGEKRTRRLHRELMHLNPSAARSLGEGLDETLTVVKLHVPEQLRKSLASTNLIESAFSIVETVCRNVKRWHGGDQRERWVGSGLLVAEKQFRRVTRIQTDSGAPQSAGNSEAFQKRSCHAEKGVVK
jgi:putative transposase